MDYYYAVNGQQNGPVPEPQLDQMVANGSLAPDTLIWSEGMANWEPYSQRRGAAAPAAPAVTLASPPAANPIPANGVVCSVCNNLFAPDQVIKYGDRYVCGACKPRFVQTLKEGVATTSALNYATFGNRFVAKVIDNILIYAIQFICGLGIGYAGLSQGVAGTLSILLMFSGIVYNIIFLGQFGATPGKMAVKIKVVTPDGGKISWGKAVVRCLSEILSGIILSIGYIMAAFDEEKRALHDRIAGTRVISIK